MYVYLAVLLAGLFAGGIGTWRVEEWRHDALAKAQMEAVAEKAKFDRRSVDTAAEGHEKDKAQIRTEFKTITQEVERIVHEPFYVDGGMCLDADGLRQLAAATGSAAAASQPARALPGPVTAR
jgi:hypothetical protein